MPRKEPLYPHVPKSKEVQFPHRTSGESSKQTTGVLPDGQPVLLKSGTEGWIKGRIVEYFDVIPSVGGMIYAGPGYKVSILEGKHKGQTIRVPANYVKAMQPQSVAQTKSLRQKYVHVLSPGQTVLHYDDTITLEAFEKENERVKKRGENPATGEILEGGKYKRIPQTQSLPQTTEKLYQRGADGYPMGSDKIMRDAWGPIPNPDQPFWSGEGFIKPVKIYGWQWSPDYHSWRAYVRFPDGTETWTSPREQTGGSLELLASTEGDPIRKFCCRQCGECAPKELLEEGRFPDRIAWLRNHYKEKHPSTWGKVGRVPQTEKLALTQTTKKPTRDDVTVQSWQERDRLGIWITDNRTDKTIAEWWDAEARQMFVDGFFKPGVPQRSTDKPGREFVESVLDYAESVGMLAKA